MERTAKKHLDAKVKYLKTFDVHVYLDHHQPGGNLRTWAIERVDPAQKQGYSTGQRLISQRMTAGECYLFLYGMCCGIEERAKAKQFT